MSIIQQFNHGKVNPFKMAEQECPSCKRIQAYHELWGYADRLCPDLCTTIPFPVEEN